MDFDFTTETITPDATGLITIGGIQGLEIPASTTGNRPGSPALGVVRVNTDTPTAAILEYWNGTSWAASSGTVTSVSVVSANGLAGTVATSSTTPAITLSTTITGVLVGNGTAISAATGSTSFPGYAAGLAGGVAGAIPYQTGANATSFSLTGTTGYVLVSGGTGSPTWTNAPTLVGTNFSGIPNGALTNSSITVTGGTGLGVAGSPVSLGGTVTLSNTGVTSAVAGTGITVSGATGAVTIGTANIPNSSLTNSSITIGTTSIALGATSTTLGGMTGITLVSGTVTGVATPSAQSDVVPLSYLQQVLAGLEWKAEAQAGTTPAIGNIVGTYANGAAGVGATFTTTGALASLDGVTLVGGGTQRVIIKDQTAGLQNGIYVVTSVGATTVFTRAIDANTSSSIDNATLYITTGTVNGGTAWTQTTQNPTMGTTAITFVQTAGTGGNSVLTFQTSLSGLTPSSATAGAVTLAGTLGLTSGGTGANLTDVPGGIVYGGATTMAFSTAGTANQLLVSGVAGAPTWTSAPTVSGANLTAATIPNGALVNSSITVTGGTGLGVVGSPVALGGTVTLSNTGVTSAVAGTGIGVSGATGAVTISNTGVTSIVAGTNISVSGATGAVTVSGPKFYSEFTTAPVNAPSATASQSVAIGTGSSASVYGALATANGEFSVAGDAQTVRAILRLSTNTATASQIMYLDGAAALLTVPTTSAWTYTIKVIARQQSPTGTYGSWIFNGMIYREAGAPTIPAGGISKTTIARVGSIATAANDPIVSAGATDLHIVVNPPAGTNVIHWVADVELVQVI